MPNTKRLFILVAAVMFALLLTLFFTAGMNAAAIVPQAPTAVIELLQNGTFDSGYEPWWSTPSVAISAPGGELQAEILNGGSNPWDAIIGQGGVYIQAGESYTLSLDARASADVTVTLLIQEDGGDYTQYLNRSLALTPTMQHFEFTFTPGDDDPAAAIQVQMGGKGEFTFYADNISLLGPEPPPPPPPGTIGELIRNGDFENPANLIWWTTDNINPSTANGYLEAEVVNGGTNPWDAIVGQHNVPVYEGGTYTLTMELWASQPVTPTFLWQQEGGAYTLYFGKALPLTTTPQTFTYVFTGTHTDLGATVQFQMGGQGEFTFYADNVSLLGPKPEVEEEFLNEVRLNQVGYLPEAPKRATIVDDSDTPLVWELRDNISNTVVATGTTTVFGLNQLSGEHVHIADFSHVMTEGISYTLHADAKVSHPFMISSGLYSQLKDDALHYFYHNRSGITITEEYAGGAQWARDAGHIGIAPNQGDYNLSCFAGLDLNNKQYQGCDYTLDVVGGWYDAGDHGKYVVNGGISVWTLLNYYERSQYIAGAGPAFPDGSIMIPENDNDVSDILDEARWEIEFLLSMQVPPTGTVEGQNLGGMVHHKIHDVAWTALGLAPADDPMMRYLYPPSTAATLNLAAVGAQCARIWEEIDPAFAARCLDAAETAWDAAQAHPAMYAEDVFTGGGPYADDNVADEFYWAASELFITTGAAEYSTALLGSPLALTVPQVITSDNGLVVYASFDWGNTTALGTISLALVPNGLSYAQRQVARANLIDAANSYVTDLEQQGYLLPFDVKTLYPWGSNSFLLNNMIVLGLAYDFTRDVIYLDAVSEGMDYLLGRNPMDQSYISGYGERALLNPHHRFWANQVDPAFPSPPPGAVSGGPNSLIQDPYAQGIFPDGCLPQKCYVDHIQAWSVNEITINWNAPLVWVTAFLDDNTGFESGWDLLLPLILKE